MTITRYLSSAATLLLLSSTAIADTAQDEWEKYGCGTDQEVGMAACFCGFLRDRLDDTSAAAASQSTEAAVFIQAQGAAVSCINGNAAGYPCDNVDLLSHIPLSTFSSSEANDVWGWTHAETGREFAIICLKDGTGFVEITDPINPIYLGKLPTQTHNSMWRDVKTYKNHAFIISEANNHGLQVFDLTQLLSLSSTPQQFATTAFYDGDIDSAHNIIINEESGYAYIVGSDRCNGGMQFVDIDDPTNPKDAGCFSDDGYTHDAHCVMYKGPDAAYQGREICFACNEDTVTIVDVTNKNDPVELDRISYTQEGYTHQGWLSSNHEYFVFGDETDERSFGFNTKTLVMDVKDLNSIQLAGTYYGPTKAIDHNLYIKDDIIYLANYRAGMRVLKVNDYSNADLTEIGYFDIFLDSDSANFNGAWSVFPFFSSGTVIISGIEQGLFMVRPTNISPTQAPSSNPTAAPTTTAPTKFPTVAPVAITPLPTLWPVTNLTDAPTDIPTSVPDNTACIPFKVSIKTDNYPGDTWWNLTKHGTEVQSMANNTLTAKEKVYNFDFCLEDGDYIFTLGDHARWKDGLCCNHGNGGYILVINGQEVVSSFGEDLFEEKVFQLSFPYKGETIFS